jgi:hypothetical protein
MTQDNLFSAFGVIIRMGFLTQGVRLRRKPWAMGCNAFGVKTHTAEQQTSPARRNEAAELHEVYPLRTKTAKPPA